jgi:endoglucanase
MKYLSFFIIFFILINNNSLFAQASTDIKLNQSGFYPQGPKVAVVTGDTVSKNFLVITIDFKDTLYKGVLSEIKHSNNSSLTTRTAEFSAFQKPGKYVIVIPGIGYSYPFSISDHVHHAVAAASLKGYYYQRVSMPLEKKFAGKWARAAGHPDTAVIIHPSAATNIRPAGTKISCPGGWYDAGDYNKYIVNSGITVGTLLSAYEDFSFYFDSLYINIPESGNGVPDILNEVLYNLRWMLTMQDPDDGGVYNKCTNAAFDGMVMPGITKAPRYVVQKGTAASLDFAAVMAQASRIFKKFQKQLPGLSDSCLHAGINAWKWAEKNPLLIYDQNEMNKMFEPKILTGGYGDKHFDDEWFWAATELFITTKEKTFYTTSKKNIHQPFSLPNWANVQALGFYSLIRNEKKMPVYAMADVHSIKKELVQFASSYLLHVNENAFQTVIGQIKKDFIWGSNAIAANQSILLINAYFITKEKKYIDYALTNLDYILGRNATGYCFVTGIGSKSTMHPHHRVSVADGIEYPVPGLMAGGPNPGRQDHCHYDFFEPETAYADISCAYASNEIAINWNAPLVYVSNAIEALQYEVGYALK